MTPRELFDQFKPLAFWVLGRMSLGRKRCDLLGFGREDLEQAALLGLWHAATRFQESRGHKFTTYATRCIYGHVIYAARTQGYLRARGNRTIRRPHAWLEDQPPQFVEQCPVEAAAVQEAREAVREAIARMDPIDRAVAERRLGADAMLKEIAPGAGMTTQGISMREMSLRKRLHGRLFRYRKAVGA